MFEIKKKLSIKKGLDLTPMIDVLFLLVFFFLVSFSLPSFSKPAALKVALPNLPETDLPETDLPKAKSAEILSEKNFPVVSIKENNLIYFEENLINLTDLGEILREGYQGEKINHLAIAADKNTLYERVVEVMSLSKKFGVEKISLKVDVEK